jgi:pheromone a factor receptor
MALAGLELISTIPISCWNIYLNKVIVPVYPWLGWEDTHIYFSRVRQVPAIIWHTNHIFVLASQMTRWSVVVCGLVFFAFFGFADEARKHYRLAFHSVAKRVGYSTGSMNMTSSNGYVSC